MFDLNRLIAPFQPQIEAFQYYRPVRAKNKIRLLQLNVTLALTFILAR